jgi:hypothetical protein
VGERMGLGKPLVDIIGRHTPRNATCGAIDLGLFPSKIIEHVVEVLGRLNCKRDWLLSPWRYAVS